MRTWCTTIYISLLMTVPAVFSEQLNIRSAHIFGSTAVKTGGDIQLNCSIAEKTQPHGELHMYLCKNGVGVRMELLENKPDHIFILRNVSVLDSGNYSCAYSLNKYSLKNVNTSGNISVHVRVTDDRFDFWPAHILGSRVAKVGGDIQLKCSITDRRRSSKKLYMYLCKNSIGVKMEWPGKKNIHIFILKNVSVLDSGNYNCVYSFKKHPLNKTCIRGLKSIQIRVIGVLPTYYLEGILVSLTLFLLLVCWDKYNRGFREVNNLYQIQQQSEEKSEDEMDDHDGSSLVFADLSCEEEKSEETDEDDNNDHDEIQANADLCYDQEQSSYSEETSGDDINGSDEYDLCYDQEESSYSDETLEDDTDESNDIYTNV